MKDLDQLLQEFSDHLEFTTSLKGTSIHYELESIVEDAYQAGRESVLKELENETYAWISKDGHTSLTDYLNNKLNKGENYERQKM